MSRDTIYIEVEAERLAQDRKWGEQNHGDVVWATVLGEEFGEACQASLNLRVLDNHAGRRALRAELVQVAAVAIAWVEALDRRPT